MKSEALKDNVSFRFDAEYFKRLDLVALQKLMLSPWDYLENLAVVTDGEHGSPDLKENGYTCLSSNNIHPFFINNNEVKQVSKKQYDKNKRVLLNSENVLLSIVGTIGKSAIIFDSIDGITDRNLATIKETSQKLNPYYLCSFLNSYFGQFQTNRFSTGNVQPLLNLGQVKSLKIPILSDTFQKQIEALVKQAHFDLQASKQAYAEAEAVLLDELGLADFTPSTEAVSIKGFAESFGSTGRLDAEYYQPKYEDYLNLIKQHQGGFKPLSKACNLKDQGYNPLEKEEYRYIELSDIGNVGEVKGCTESLGVDLPSRARRKVQTGDVLVSSIEGSLGSCALVPSLYNNALCSTGFYVVASNEINPETLLVLFKSEPMQSILKQNCSGTILTAVNKQEFLGIPIPIINITQQRRIADLVERSFTLKAQSEALLAIAKRGVELAIESDEASAQAWMLEQSGGLLASPGTQVRTHGVS